MSKRIGKKGVIAIALALVAVIGVATLSVFYRPCKPLHAVYHGQILGRGLYADPHGAGRSVFCRGGCNCLAEREWL